MPTRPGHIHLEHLRCLAKVFRSRPRLSRNASRYPAEVFTTARSSRFVFVQSVGQTSAA